MSGFDHFNFLSPIYDVIFGRSEDHEMLEIAGVEPGHYLLDVGGGTGRVTVLFDDVTERMLIVDAAFRMLQEAHGKGLSSVNANSETLPLPAKTFDRVIMVDALHHVKNQQQTLNEIWRVLAPGGRMVIEEPDIHNFWVKLVALGEKLALMRSQFIAPDKILEMCQFPNRLSTQLIKKNGIAWIIINKAN